MQYKLPVIARLQNGDKVKVIELFPDKVTIESEKGLYQIDRTKVCLPARHMGHIYIPAEEDYSSAIEVIWAETFEKARDYAVEHIFADRPCSPYDCTGSWFTTNAEWIKIEIQNIYMVRHNMACDV